MATEKCELCGKTFACGRGIGCWCAGVEVSGDRRGELRSLTGRCACPECLGGKHS